MVEIDIRKALEAWIPNVPQGMVDAIEAIVEAKYTKVRQLRLTQESGLAEGYFQADFMPFIADGLVGWFKEQGGVNYVELTLHDPQETERAKGEYLLTLKRQQGKTPHQLRQEAEAERDALRESLIEIERLARLAATAIARDPEAEFHYLQSLALKALRGDEETTWTK